MKEKEPYITVYQSIGGWKAVLMTWDDEFDFYSPWQTSIMGGFDNKEDAIEDGKRWAEDEEIKFV